MMNALTLETAAVLALCAFAVPFGLIAGTGAALWFLGWLDSVTSGTTER